MHGYPENISDDEDKELGNGSILGFEGVDCAQYLIET